MVDGPRDRNGNVLPGTTVENSLKDNDFFCVTQAALQVVSCLATIHDENNIPLEDCQRLVMNGCFTYQRTTRSVSLHPAVYYAHQVAERVKMHMREENGQTVLREGSRGSALHYGESSSKLQELRTDAF
jgi:Piwi domain